jgi:hypothetical protein
MDANVRKRASARVIVTLILAAALALIPPVLYHDLVYGEFFLEDAAKDIANQFLDATRWIHAGGIIAVWLLNLIFFSINQRKGDCGRKLMGRNTLQNVLNILLILLSVAAMIGYRYALSADVWIGLLFPTADISRIIVWMPYYSCTNSYKNLIWSTITLFEIIVALFSNENLLLGIVLLKTCSRCGLTEI